MIITDWWIESICKLIPACFDFWTCTTMTVTSFIFISSSQSQWQPFSIYTLRIKMAKAHVDARDIPNLASCSGKLDVIHRMHVCQFSFVQPHWIYMRKLHRLIKTSILWVPKIEHIELALIWLRCETNVSVSHHIKCLNPFYACLRLVSVFKFNQWH